MSELLSRLDSHVAGLQEIINATRETACDLSVQLQTLTTKNKKLKVEKAQLEQEIAHCKQENCRFRHQLEERDVRIAELEAAVLRATSLRATALRAITSPVGHSSTRPNALATTAPSPVPGKPALVNGVASAVTCGRDLVLIDGGGST
ncbi:hypothetical protein CLOP_g10684, partial [Closterium sp. NIES-67]